MIKTKTEHIGTSTAYSFQNTETGHRYICTDYTDYIDALLREFHSELTSLINTCSDLTICKCCAVNEIFAIAKYANLIADKTYTTPDEAEEHYILA